jgi:hypothetical protein
MKPARWDFLCNPGITFPGRVFVALDENFAPVDLSGFTPRANVRLSANGPVILDLNPSLVTPANLPASISYTVGSQVLTSAAHGLGTSMNLEFLGALPAPLRTEERYIVLASNLTANTFSVISFHSAMLGENVPVRISGVGTSPTFVGRLTVGQVKIPEVSDETTNVLADANAFWDLLMEDPSGRVIGYYAAGGFIIKRGMTV